MITNELDKTTQIVRNPQVMHHVLKFYESKIITLGELFNSSHALFNALLLGQPNCKYSSKLDKNILNYTLIPSETNTTEVTDAIKSNGARGYDRRRDIHVGHVGATVVSVADMTPCEHTRKTINANTNSVFIMFQKFPKMNATLSVTAPGDIMDSFDLVFHGVFMYNHHTCIVRPHTNPLNAWENRPFWVLSRDAVLRTAARRLGMHVGGPRDQHVSPHISHDGTMSTGRHAPQCLIDWINRYLTKLKGPKKLKKTSRLDQSLFSETDDEKHRVEQGVYSEDCVLKPFLNNEFHRWLLFYEHESIIPGFGQNLSSLLFPVLESNTSSNTGNDTENNTDQNVPPVIICKDAVAGRVGTDTRRSIATQYNSTTFASLVEARWAFVFDHLDINWSYESHMVSGASFEHLLPEQRAGKKFYKPDFFLRDFHTAIEIKGTTPSLAEKRLCIAYAKEFGPIILLYGGSGGGDQTKHLFSYGEQIRETSYTTPGCTPHALRFDRDVSRPSGVVVEAVYFGRVSGGAWGFAPLADCDYCLTENDHDVLRNVHNDAVNTLRKNCN
jgi:hypothetical protein